MPGTAGRSICTPPCSRTDHFEALPDIALDETSEHGDAHGDLPSTATASHNSPVLIGLLRTTTCGFTIGSGVLAELSQLVIYARDWACLPAAEVELV
ncbi:hypothetical protein [Streptomyces sp. NPDC058297]|uniref:hypothetical protein n=1 Tax=Streptomyces sp. NPDC058297 TaxID=3346433 RepID=UPI0036EFDE20